MTRRLTSLCANFGVGGEEPYYKRSTHYLIWLCNRNFGLRASALRGRSPHLNPNSILKPLRLVPSEPFRQAESTV